MSLLNKSISERSRRFGFLASKTLVNIFFDILLQVRPVEKRLKLIYNSRSSYMAMKRVIMMIPNEALSKFHWFHNESSLLSNSIKDVVLDEKSSYDSPIPLVSFGSKISTDLLAHLAVDLSLFNLI